MKEDRQTLKILYFFLLSLKNNFIAPAWPSNTGAETQEDTPSSKEPGAGHTHY